MKQHLSRRIAPDPLGFPLFVGLLLYAVVSVECQLMTTRLSQSSVLPTVSCGSGPNPGGGSLDWGDFDKDGDQDLLIGGYTDTSGNLTIMVNNGACNFTKRSISLQAFYTTNLGSTGYNSYGWWVTAAQFLDLNGDSNLDIVASVFIQIPSPGPGSGNGNFAFVPQFSWPGTVTAQTSSATNPDPVWASVPNLALYSADCDVDGDTDIIFFAQISTAVYPPRVAYVYKNIGGMLFEPMPILTGIGWDMPRQYSVAIGDIDGDGIPDLAWTCLGSGMCNGRPHVILSLGNGDCTFGPIRAGPPINPGFGALKTYSLILSPTNSNAPALGDCDGDQDLDFLVTAPMSTSAVSTASFGGGLMVNQGKMNFVRMPPPTGLEGLLTSQFVDVNGDGKLDIYGAATSLLSAIYINQGNCTYSAPQYVNRTGGSPLDYPAGLGAWGDCDKDGDLDLIEICGSYSWFANGLGYMLYSGPTLLFRNTVNVVPSPTASPRISPASTCSSSSSDLPQVQMSIADMNNDGELDIVLAGSTSSSVNILLQSHMNFLSVAVPAN